MIGLVVPGLLSVFVFLCQMLQCFCSCTSVIWPQAVIAAGFKWDVGLDYNMMMI